MPDLARAAADLARAARSKTDLLGTPFQAPKSVLNGRIKGVQIAIAEATEAAGHVVSPEEAVRIAMAR